MTLPDLRVAVDEVAFEFDATNPRTTEWITDHTGELIEGISSATRDSIRGLVESAFEEQFDVDELADHIGELLGDDDRAERIARTETMRASNEGLLESWRQALDEELIEGDLKKEWITTPDDRLCPVCEPLDGEQVGVDETFSVGVVTPPAHPNCRCTMGLSA